MRSVLLLCVLSLYAGTLSAQVLGKVLAQRIFRASSVGEAIWVATADSVVRVEGNNHYDIAQEAPHYIAEMNDEVWLATGSGLQRYSLAGELVFSEAGSPGYESPLLLEGRNRVPKITAMVFAVNNYWVGTEEALFRVSRYKDRIEATPVLKEKITDLLKVSASGGEGEYLWVATANAIWVSSGETFEVVRRLSKRESVGRLVKAHNTVWITLYRGSGDKKLPKSALGFSLAGDEKNKEFKGNFITQVGQCGGTTLFGAASLLYRLDRNGNLKSVKTLRSLAPIESIVEIGSQCWVSTAGSEVLGIPPSSIGKLRTQRYVAHSVNVSGFIPHRGKLWAFGDGLHRLEPDTTIDFADSVRSLGGFHLHFNNIFNLGEPYYFDKELGNPFEGAPDPGFGVFLASSRLELTQSIASGKVNLSDSNYLRISGGLQDVYIAVRDTNGNMVERRLEGVWHLHPVVMSLLGPGLLVFLVAWLAAFLSIFFSPWSDFCIGVVDSPLFRSRLSFGGLPFMLLFRCARRRVLRRYICNFVAMERGGRIDLRHRGGGGKAGKSGGPAESARDCEAGGQPDVISTISIHPGVFEDIQMCSSVLCVGEDDLQRIFLDQLGLGIALGKGRGLVRRFSKIKKRDAKFRIKNRGQLGVAIPIRITLPAFLKKSNEDAALEDLVAAVHAELANLGDLNDPELVSYLLDCGGFAILCDGFELLDPREKWVITQFLRRFCRENFIVVGSADGVDMPIDSERRLLAIDRDGRFLQWSDEALDQEQEFCA